MHLNKKGLNWLYFRNIFKVAVYFTDTFFLLYFIEIKANVHLIT